MNLCGTNACNLYVSETLYARALARMPGGNTRSTLYTSPSSPYVAHGSGCELEDVDGHRLIDLHGNYTALVHGNAHPAIVEAAASAIQSGSCFGLPSAADVELAEHLHERQPSLAKLRFTNSGSDAVMMAVRAARAWTGRDRILRFAGCYHGIYDALASDGSRGRSAALEAEVISVPEGDAEGFVRAIAAHGEKLACVLMDLMPNRTGLAPASPDFVRLVRHETERRGIVWIVDRGDHLSPLLRWNAGLVRGRSGLEGVGQGHWRRLSGGGVRRPRGDHARVRPATAGRSRSWRHLQRQPGDDEGRSCGSCPPRSRADREDQQAGRAAASRAAGLGYEVNGRGSLLRLVGEIDMSQLWWSLYRSGVLVAHDGLMSVSTAMNDEVIDRVLERFAKVG